MIKCANCLKDTNNPKYCSRSCAAIMTNKLKPKRTKVKKWLCVVCNQPCVYRCKYCKEHSLRTRLSLMTKGDLHTRLSVKGKHPSWANVEIRNLARSKNKDLLEKPCSKCGYDKHVELCHIKPIKDFSLDALVVSEINHPTNLVQLCPNCHWELDSLKKSTVISV